MQAFQAVCKLVMVRFKVMECCRISRNFMCVCFCLFECETGYLFGVAFWTIKIPVCVDQDQESLRDSKGNTDGVTFHHTCGHGHLPMTRTKKSTVRSVHQVKASNNNGVLEL